MGTLIDLDAERNRLEKKLPSMAIFSDDCPADAGGTIVKFFRPIKYHRIHTCDLMFLFENLGSQKLGCLSLEVSLGIVGDSTSNQEFRYLIGQLRRDVAQGLPFHKAIGKHPELFTPFVCQLVQEGEGKDSLEIYSTMINCWFDKMQGYKEMATMTLAGILMGLLLPLVFVCMLFKLSPESFFQVPAALKAVGVFLIVSALITFILGAFIHWATLMISRFGKISWLRRCRY